MSCYCLSLARVAVGVAIIIRLWVMLTPADARWPHTVSVAWHYPRLGETWLFFIKPLELHSTSQKKEKKKETK